ncbi:MAG: hypothetical protein ACJAYG_001067 [Oceanicoccus sp.]|jgi:hypothetical protein
MWRQVDQAASSRPFGGDIDTKKKRAQDVIEQTIQSANAVILIACEYVAHDKKIIGTIAGHLYQRPDVKLSSNGVIHGLWVNEKTVSKALDNYY